MLFSKKVVLDTNFLLIPGQFKVDIFEEIRRISDFKYKLYIFSETLNELEKILVKGKTIDKTAAKIAKSLIKLKEISILEGDEAVNVDEQFVEYAKNHDICVATLDAALQRKIRAANPKTIFIIMRGKKYLALM